MIFNIYGEGKAKEIEYDKSNSNIKSDNVQGAIDELANRIIFATEEPEEVPENSIVMVYEE